MSSFFLFWGGLFACFWFGADASISKAYPWLALSSGMSSGGTQEPFKVLVMTMGLLCLRQRLFLLFCLTNPKVILSFTFFHCLHFCPTSLLLKMQKIVKTIPFKVNFVLSCGIWNLVKNVISPVNLWKDSVIDSSLLSSSLFQVIWAKKNSSCSWVECMLCI